VSGENARRGNCHAELGLTCFSLRIRCIEMLSPVDIQRPVKTIQKEFVRHQSFLSLRFTGISNYTILIKTVLSKRSRLSSIAANVQMMKQPCPFQTTKNDEKCTPRCVNEVNKGLRAPLSLNVIKQSIEFERKRHSPANCGKANHLVYALISAALPVSEMMPLSLLHVQIYDTYFSPGSL
jgi:hypothetical protein